MCQLWPPSSPSPTYPPFYPTPSPFPQTLPFPIPSLSPPHPHPFPLHPHLPSHPHLLHQLRVTHHLIHHLLIHRTLRNGWRSYTFPHPQPCCLLACISWAIISGFCASNPVEPATWDLIKTFPSIRLTSLLPLTWHLLGLVLEAQDCPAQFACNHASSIGPTQPSLFNYKMVINIW